MNPHLRRAGRLALAASRRLWWAIWGSPPERQEDWRRHSRQHFSLDCIRRVEEWEARKRAARETLTFERAVKDHRRKGWVSFVKETKSGQGEG